MKTRSSILALLTVLASFVVSGCAAEASSSSAPVVKHAICRILGTQGNEKVKGVVYFTQEGANVRIKAEVEGLTPGEHGFHVHEWGDINCTDGKCTGGHFNPTGAKHGAPDAAVRHVGDLGNLKADGSGKATYDRLDKVLKLNGSHGCIGRAIIVHAQPDDWSQPTGNAGARVAYGVIGINDPEGK
jgi:superoxide dismutase, Cu-Zn family